MLVSYNVFIKQKKGLTFMNTTKINKTGINMTQLKLIGIILMVFDHMHEFFQFIPDWFSYLGRPVAPIFLFSLAEGMHYTSNRKKYLSRLYICSALMAIGNTLIVKYIPPKQDMILMNNIFATLFLSGLYIMLIDNLKESIKSKNIVSILKYILLMLLPLIISALTLMIMTSQNISLITLKIIMIFLPNPILVEGGIVFVILGVILYLFRDNRKVQVITFIVVSLLSLILGSGFNLNAVFVKDYQWMMIFASIFMLLYNGEKGNGNKQFFYIFYPAHIYIFYIISVLFIK
jgi:hypothetical protein